MRKVFWCSLAGGFLVFGGVFTAAHFAASHPHSFVGKAVLTAGRIVVETNPVSVLNSAIVRIEEGREESAGEATVGCEEPAEAVEMREVRGAIVIPDNEPVQLHAEIEPVFDHLVQVAHDDAPECLVGGDTECPLSMPLCDQEQGEKLGMPCSEGDVEEQEETGTGSTGAVEKLFRLFEKAVKKSEEGAIDAVAPAKEAVAPVSQTPDYHHGSHYQHSGCPYTGHGSMYCPTRSYQPTMPTTPPPPMTQPGSEEANEPAKPEQHSSAPASIRRTSPRGVEDAATNAEIDTMEFRVADGQLYDYGPGSM